MRIRYPLLLIVGFLCTAQSQAAGFLQDMAIRGGFGAGRLTLDNSGSFDGHSGAWNLFAGFEFNRYLAVEAGRIEGGAPEQDLGSGLVDEVKNYSWHGSAIGSLPVNDLVSFFARAGMVSWHATERLKSAGTTIASLSKTGTDPIYGGGVDINVDSGLLRLEYDRSKIYDIDATLISISVVWRFKL